MALHAVHFLQVLIAKRVAVSLTHTQTHTQNFHADMQLSHIHIAHTHSDQGLPVSLSGD